MPSHIGTGLGRPQHLQRINGRIENATHALLRVAFRIRYHEVSREDGKYSFNSATRRGFKYIGVIDRSELLTYIEGGIDKFEKIVPEAGTAADLERVLQIKRRDR